MKKQIILITIIGLFLLMLPPMAGADPAIVDSGECGDNLTWTLDDDGLLTIDGTGMMSDYGNDGGPWGKDAPKKIIIQEGVTSIGMNAFGGGYSGCQNVTEVVLPSTLSTIKSRAFFGCTLLTNISLPDNVISIGDVAFANCVSLTNFSIPKGTTSIATNCFTGCTNLTCIKIPKSVTQIGEYAFLYCDNLNTVYFSGTADQWRNVQIHAYNNVLDNVEIIFNYIEIVASGTCGDTLTWTLDDEGLLAISGTGNMDDYSYTYDSANDLFVSSAPWGLYSSEINSITIENGVTSIGEAAFIDCRNMTNINIPDSVTSIGEEAFCYCKTLSSVTIPEGVTRIEDGTFIGCRKLVSVSISESVVSIGESAFEACTSMTAINIPESVLSIGDWAFEFCQLLTDITIPNSVTSIGDYAFSDCYSLAAITIPDSVISIGNEVLNNCNNLLRINVPSTNCFAYQWAVEHNYRNKLQITMIHFDLTAGTPVGTSEAVEFTTNNFWTDERDVTIHSFSRVDLNNNCIRYSLSFTAPEGFEMAVFGSDSDYQIFSKGSLTTLEKTSIQFDVEENIANNLTISFYNSDNNGRGMFYISFIHAKPLHFNLTDGVPMNNPETTPYVVTNNRWTDGRTVIIHSFTFIELDNNYIRYLFTFTAPEGYRIAVFDTDHADDPNRFVITSSGAKTVSQPTSVQFDIEKDIVDSLTISFFQTSGMFFIKIPHKAILPIAINETNFPDSIFREYVSTSFDTSDPKDNKLDYNEIVSITDINLNGIRNDEYKGIQSLKGIELFPNLSNLNCCLINISEIDVQSNTKLRRLILENCNLSDLDVTKNTLLTFLDCMGNKLTSIDLSQNIKLISLFCHSNRLTSLELSSNHLLKNLCCNFNSFTRLDISACDSLNELVQTSPRTYDESTSADIWGEMGNSYLQIDPAVIVIADAVISRPRLEMLSCLYLPTSLRDISSEAFSNLACQAIIISENCTTIGERAFADCTNLLYVRIPSTVTSYPANAFEGCNENLVIDWEGH